MSFDTYKKDLKAREEDPQVEMALRNFRESVRGWSEQEFARPRVVQPSRRGMAWWFVRHTGAAWALAVVVAVSGVSVPVGVHFHNEQLRIEAQRVSDAVEQAKQQHLAEVQRQADTIDDEALLKDVDSDIAQGTPDAMEPLASLMSDSATK
jgi:hypothetical protein